MPKCKHCGFNCKKTEMQPGSGKTGYRDICAECFNILEGDRRWLRNYLRRGGRKSNLPNAYCVFDPTGVFSDRYLQGWRVSIGVWPENSVWEITNVLTKRIKTFRLIGDGPDQIEEEIQCRGA